MNLWEHERVLASAHSSVHVNKLNMMQRQLRGMEEKAAVVEKRSQVALREVCPSLNDPDDTLPRPCPPCTTVSSTSRRRMRVVMCGLSVRTCPAGHQQRWDDTSFVPPHADSRVMAQY